MNTAVNGFESKEADTHKNACSNIKVIAMGNILMKDDAIGIEVAKVIEERLLERGIEVIYVETDVQYGISNVQEDDYILVLDSACYGKEPGEITCFPLSAYVSKKKGYSQHNYSFLDLLKLYYPSTKGDVYAIEVKEVEFGFGLSSALQEKLEAISKEILKRIEKYIIKNKVYERKGE
ncbi:hydrogenase maturation protease [uncultured Clostridium sp.]|uniref:hydrogenase maturation protease n=1 Tax=uncultured Clostridium sp. TaxID=59620 RepID=UPI0028E5C118|nr:hydrogenase maturation protease [uncultured Clostridium sp.]